MSGSMKRWMVPKFGAANLSLVEMPIPTPAPGAVLVKVAAVSLNYRDRMMIENGFGHGQAGAVPARAFTPGSDLAGEVVAVGEGVSRFAVGARVISVFAGGWLDGQWPGAGPRVQTLGGPTTTGTLAEYVALPDDWLVAAPASLSDVEAGTVSTAGLTAWFALVESGPLRAGQTVLIQGTGGVSLYALQIAVAMGAEAIVVTSSADRAERVKALGATHAIDRNATPDWAQAVLDLTGGRGADHVLEMVGGDNLNRSLQALATGGTVSLIGFLETFDSRLSTGLMIAKRARIQGQMVGHRRALEDLVRAIDRTGIKPPVAAEYPLRELPAAFAHYERAPFGKVVVRMGD